METAFQFVPLQHTPITPLKLALPVVTAAFNVAVWPTVPHASPITHSPAPISAYTTRIAPFPTVSFAQLLLSTHVRSAYLTIISSIPHAFPCVQLAPIPKMDTVSLVLLTV